MGFDLCFFDEFISVIGTETDGEPVTFDGDTVTFDGDATVTW